MFWSIPYFQMYPSTILLDGYPIITLFLHHIPKISLDLDVFSIYFDMPNQNIIPEIRLLLVGYHIKPH
jgi:hypothetical protein